MSTATHEPHPLAARLRHLPTPLAVSGVVLVLASIAGWVVDGGFGAIGAAVGVLIAAGGYAMSAITVAWADWISPKLVLTVGLACYVFKISLLGLALLGVLRQDWPGGRMMAIGMAVAIVAWVAAQTWWTARDPIPAVPPRPVDG
ncbi:hypothetical protein [Actinoplanes sp. G11-F43]|uniref:hypothetical protein n=1 Tax=Actinoplanes sp. G11-F43 TaxID=3424130 RepID=UPI003D32D76C